MKLNLKITASLLALSLAGCTGNYFDINSNPYEPNGDQMQGDGYIINTAMANLASTVISTDVNTSQFTDCLLGGPLGGYFADSKQSWEQTISNYNPTDDWTRVYLASNECVPKIYSNLADLQKNTDDKVVLAIAQVIKVAAMHRVTDAYGPIPYTQITIGGELQVGYDSQEAIYNKMFEELDAAIVVLSANRASTIPPNSDYIYGGNVGKWAKFANSLKLRLAMRIVYANKPKAQEMAEQAASDEGGLMTDNSDNAQLTSFGDKGNPIHVAVNYNNEGSVTGGDAHAAADIIAYMNGYKDPRRAAYFIPSQWNGIQYVGLRHGIIIPEKAVAIKYSGVKTTITSPLVWMNAAEVAFLRAEAAGVFKFNMGGTAESFYNQGIRLSFAQWKVEGADEYLANKTDVPENYVDPYGANTYSDALSRVTIAWNEGATPEEMQERIITQKWIANWILGNEAWADYRRTGYPHIIPATDEGNKSLGIVNSKLGARRMPYPTNEYTTNNANVLKAITTYFNGKDNMAGRMWWDCNPAIK